MFLSGVRGPLTLAIYAMARSAVSLPDRLREAYAAHLSHLTASDFPGELGEVFNEISLTLAQSATAEPMSPDEAIGVADKIIALHARVAMMEEDDWATPG